MCYVLKFRFDDSYKACKFTAFPRTFQIINYLFFKEVGKRNIVRWLSCNFKGMLFFCIELEKYSIFAS